MEGPNKGLSPKKGSSGPNNPNSGEKERNENDCDSQNLMNSKMQNPKKPMAKHFMSPTISAASKVSAPRKKVLGDRNGIPPISDTHAQKTPNLDSRNDHSGRFSPKIISSYSCASESDDDEKSSPTAYDPSSSYLSPRPKYLRYNPNRRQEVLRQLENRGGKGDDCFGAEESDLQNVVGEEVSSSEDQDSSNPSVGNSSVTAEIEENKMNHCLNVLDSEKGTSQGVVEKHVFIDEVEGDLEEEVEEEFKAEQYEEVQGWRLRGVMQSRNLRSLKSENEENKINNCLDVNRSDFVDSENDTFQIVVKKHNFEDVEEKNDDEEVEDFNEEAEQSKQAQGGWSLKGIMKFLVVLSILVLGTFFLFSIDSTVYNSEEITAGPEDGYNSIWEHTSEDVDVCLLKDGYGSYMGVVKPDFEEIKPKYGYNSIHDRNDIEEVVMESVPPEQVEIVETQVGWNDVHAMTDKWPGQFNDQLIAESADSTNVSEMETEVEWNEDVHDLGTEWQEFSDQQDPCDGSELNGRKEEQSGMPKYDEESVDLLLAKEYIENHSFAEWLKFSGQQNVSAIAESDGSELNSRKEQSGMPNYDEETVDLGLANEYVENHSFAEESQAQPPELLVEADMVESEINWTTEPVDDFLEDATVGESPLSGKEDTIIAAESINTMASSKMGLSQLRNKTTRSKIIWIISTLFSMISGSLVFKYRSKGRKDSEVSKIIPIEKPVVAEESCPVTPKVEEKKTEKLAEPRAASSLFDFSEQASKEFSYRSPTIQLLGELVVREVERSLRRCDKKVESEESNNVQQRKKAAFQISSPPAPAAPEYSIADSPSCFGSFTTEARILKKENGKDAEIKTPVRRSSRIRSRSMTPSCSSAI